MRSLLVRSFATLALLAVVAGPAFAGKKTTKDAKASKKRSLAECTSFGQQDREAEDGVDLAVTNSCSVAVTCSVSWTLTCAPESKKRRSSKADSHVFSLDSAAALTVSATTERCGDAGWALTDIQWSCAPKAD